MGNKDKETRERAFRDRKEALTEWTCHYCPEVATTIRQGSAVCYHHAAQLRLKVGLAKRILSRLRTGLSKPDH
jgi:hypothetical protein